MYAFLNCIYLHGPLKINLLTDVATVLKGVKINQINQSITTVYYFCEIAVGQSHLRIGLLS